LKRQSSTSAPPDPEFFADRNLGQKFVSKLREAGFTVHAHDDCFPQKTSDVSWIPVVTNNGWITLTGDKNMARDLLEVRCHIENGARTFIIGGQQSPSEFAENLINNKHRLTRYIDRAEKRGVEAYIVRVGPPDKRKLDKRCKFTLWMNEEKWLDKLKG